MARCEICDDCPEVSGGTDTVLFFRSKGNASYVCSDCAAEIAEAIDGFGDDDVEGPLLLEGEGLDEDQETSGSPPE